MSKIIKPITLYRLVLGAFVLKCLDIIRVDGMRPLVHATGDIEMYVRDGATGFATRGWNATAWLPVYPTYEIHSSIEKLKVNHVYAHQFAGPDYLLGLWFNIFGTSDTAFQWARLLPLSLLILSFTYWIKTLSKFSTFKWGWAAPFLVLAVLYLPAMIPWAVQLGSEAYGSACVLFVLAWTQNQNSNQKSKNITQNTLLTGLLLGALSLLAYMPLCFVIVSIPLAFRFLTGRFLRRFDFQLSTALGLGMVLLFVLRLAQLTHYLGSFSDAIQSQIDIAKYRIGGPETVVLPSTIRMFGIYSLAVRGFFRFGSITMLLTGFFGVYLLSISLREKANMALSLVVATTSAYVWVLLVRGYAMAHTHFHPRSFLFLYLIWILVWVRVATDRDISQKKNNI